MKTNKQKQLFDSEEEAIEDFEDECDNFIDEDTDELENVNTAVKQMITTFYSPKLESSEKNQIQLGSDFNIGVELIDSKSSFSQNPRTTIVKISTQHLLQLLSAMDIYRKTDSIEEFLIIKTMANKKYPEFPMLVIEDNEKRGYIVPRMD